MPRGFGYGNARLRARRSRLLAPVDYDRLLAQPTPEALLSALTGTPYQSDLEAALMQVSRERAIFEALRRNFTRTLCEARSFYTGSAQFLIDLLLRRWDRHNLLAILRGQSHKIAASQIQEALIPVGRLDEVSLRELARQPGLSAALDLMTAWRLPYANALQETRAQFGIASDPDRLELSLNQAHYYALLRELAGGNGNRRVVRDWLCTEIDLVNLRTALRLVSQPGLVALVQQRYDSVDIEPLLVQPGGHLPAAMLAQLVNQAGSLADIIEGLRDTRYATALHTGWERYRAANGGEPMLERELERWQAYTAAALFGQNPLGIDIPLGYLVSKEVEIANLRLIAQAVTLELEREAVKPDLILLVTV